MTKTSPRLSSISDISGLPFFSSEIIIIQNRKRMPHGKTQWLLSISHAENRKRLSFITNH